MDHAELAGNVEIDIKKEMLAASPAFPSFHYVLPPSAQPTLFSRVPFNYKKKLPQAEVLIFHTGS
ncbi:MAG: hypothetical protein WAV18_04580 [Roseiarcus sp.]